MKCDHSREQKENVCLIDGFQCLHTRTHKLKGETTQKGEEMNKFVFYIFKLIKSLKNKILITRKKKMVNHMLV